MGFLAMVAEGDCVGANEVLRAVRATGEPYENMYCHWFRFEGEAIAEVWEHVDTCYSRPSAGKSAPSVEATGQASG